MGGEQAQRARKIFEYTGDMFLMLPSIESEGLWLCKLQIIDRKKSSFDIPKLYTNIETTTGTKCWGFW